jgi:TonB family protein
MRDELHLMELVDRYLDGGMGEDERMAFEERMRASGELQGLVDDQRALREGLDRVHLRKALASAHRTWTITRWVPWMVAGLFLLAAGGWFLRSSTEREAHSEVPHVQVSEVPNGTGTDFPTSDPLPEQLDLDTRVETVFMRTPSSAERKLDTTRGEGRIVTHLITRQSEAVQERGTTAKPVEQEGTTPAGAGTSAREPVHRDDDDHIFRGNRSDSVAPPVPEPDGEKTVLATVERFENASKPEFPGGIEEMQRFIQDNLKQPRGTKKSGTVTVGFTVNKKGEVVNVEIIRSLTRAFDAEAVRVINCMPLWEPSRLGDRPVKSKLQVHVRFKGVPKKRAEKEDRR